FGERQPFVGVIETREHHDLRQPGILVLGLRDGDGVVSRVACNEVAQRSFEPARGLEHEQRAVEDDRFAVVKNRQRALAAVIPLTGTTVLQSRQSPPSKKSWRACKRTSSAGHFERTGRSCLGIADAVFVLRGNTYPHLRPGRGFRLPHRGTKELRISFPSGCIPFRAKVSSSCESQTEVSHLVPLRFRSNTTPSGLPRCFKSTSAIKGSLRSSGATKVMSAVSSHCVDTLRMNAVLFWLRPSNSIFGSLQLCSAAMPSAWLLRKALMSLADTAKFNPSPSVARNELIPTILPSSDNSGPPEFPGLIGVWV